MTLCQRLQQSIAETGSALCVGIDPRPARHPSPEEVGIVCERLIAETAPMAAAFKPNIAYFEAMGPSGYRLLETLISRIRETGRPVILDAKRGDIGTTQEHYAEVYFGRWQVDAVTLSPYMGFDSISPFLGFPGRGVFLLGVTSNPGAADLETCRLDDGRFVFERVCDLCRRAGNGEAGLVLGLTNATPEILARIPDVPLLVPGLGAQGGDLEQLAGESRRAPALINVSRGILYEREHLSFSEKAIDYANQITRVLGRGH